MKTTGYDLREAIKQHELRRDTAARGFNGALKKFPGEEKQSPESIVEAFTAAEVAITTLQTAQMRYNLAVTVTASGKTMPLALAIKLVGGIARVEKMWRSVAGPKEDRYGYSHDDVRDPNQLRAVPTVPAGTALKLASAAAKRSSALRKAIAVGNATEVEIEGLDAALFE
jgi:hypothetical protein